MLCKSDFSKIIFKNFYVNNHKILIELVKKDDMLLESLVLWGFCEKSVKFLIAFLRKV